MATLNYATQYLQALLQEFPYVPVFRRPVRSAEQRKISLG